MIPPFHNFQHARDFQRLFPSAEHKIVPAVRDLDEPEGWTAVSEWISRANLFNRYVVVLRVAVKIEEDEAVSALEAPKLEVIEVEKVTRSKVEKGGPKYELMWYPFEEGAWEELVANSGDFSALGFELNKDSPADRFEVYWQDTR